MSEKIVSIEEQRQKVSLFREMELIDEKYLRSNETEEFFYVDSCGTWYISPFSSSGEWSLVNPEFGKALSAVCQRKLTNKE